MIKLSARRAAVVMAGGALVLAGTIPALAASAPPGWRVAATYAVPGGSSILSGVDAVGPRDAWSIGIAVKTNASNVHSVVRHWNGRAWVMVALPVRVAAAWNRQSPVLAQIGASSATNVWAFSDLPGGRFLRLNGRHWSVGRLPGSNPTTGSQVVVTAAKVFSTTNVWAFGATVTFSSTNPTASPTVTPYAAHFNGSRWATPSVPGTGAIVDVSAASPGNLWAVIGNGNSILNTGVIPSQSTSAVLNWTANTGWTQAPVQPALPTGGTLSSVLVRGGTVWVGGSVPNTAKGTTPISAKLPSGGSAWTITNLPFAPTTAKWGLGEMTPDGHGGIWAIIAASNRGSQRIWHLHGATWSQVRPNFGAHPWVLAQMASVPRTASVWAVGATKRGSLADGLVAITGPMPR